jgi:AraC family transcriptional regulator of adaptative response/methylated-DNA-[protein]-cysteine methyltransferase
MKEQDHINFNRIAKAIDYLKSNFQMQPDLEKLAREMNMGPFHFQRLFKDWAGTSPKKFLQYISLGHAKKLLKEHQATLFDTAYETGLSGTGRLHDLFVKIEGMTPAEYKHGGKNLSINYSFATSRFGKILVASTCKGICNLAFADDGSKAIADLKDHFPNAVYHQQEDLFQKNALSVFKQDWNKLHQVKLHLKGTDFQLKVWETLLQIPMGKLATYGAIARQIDREKSSRAVGTAIGNNPIAYLIPCHRVIRSSGIFGGYMWGNIRKTAMIGWESAKTIIETADAKSAITDHPIKGLKGKQKVIQC